MHYPLKRLSNILNMSEETLSELSDSADSAYHRFPVRKRSGQLRWIDSPDESLKKCQRHLLERILYRMPVSGAAHGFVPGRSIVTNAVCHEGQAWVIAFDLKNFFPSVTRTQVDQVVARIPDIAQADVDVVGKLLTKNGVLPQGAPTSPYMANLVFESVDIVLARLADEAELRYTRYADDLTFSGSSVPKGFDAAVDDIVRTHGFKLNKRKTRRMGQHTRQMVTGLVVNERARLPRPLRRWMRVVRHDVLSRGIERVQLDFPELTEDRLAGYVAFARMVQSRCGTGRGTRHE